MKKIVVMVLIFLPSRALPLQETTQTKAPQIETARVVLRQWKEDDKNHLHELMDDPEVNKFLKLHGSREKVEEFISKATKNIAQKGYGYFACEDKETGEFMGWAGLNYVDWIEGEPFPCYTISGVLARKYWKQGYAFEAGQALLALGFEQHQLPEIHACAVAQNVNSENAMRRLGLISKGTFDFPGIAKDHSHCRHVLYVITKDMYERKMKEAQEKKMSE